MSEFINITKNKHVAIYEASIEIFKGLIKEIRELSKKKPDATMSAGKVKLINRVLQDLKSILSHEPEGKYLDILSDEDLPQFSDAVLVMVQYESAAEKFYNRYNRLLQIDWDGRKRVWITKQTIAAYESFQIERQSEYDEDGF